MEESVEYIVVNENTLGYVDFRYPDASLSVGVLRGNVFKGGPDPKNGPIVVLPQVNRVRPATLEDFESYRISVPSSFKADLLVARCM